MCKGPILQVSANAVQVSADAVDVQGDISEQNQVSADADEVQGDTSEQNQVSTDAVEVQGDISEQNQVSADSVQVQGDISEQNQVSADAVQVQDKSTLSQGELICPLQLPSISKCGLPIKDEVMDALAALPPPLVTSTQTTPNISLNGHDQLVMVMIS